jgi:Na+/proline symporter
MNSIAYVVIVVLYVLVMLAVGYWCMKRTKTSAIFSSADASSVRG